MTDINSPKHSTRPQQRAGASLYRFASIRLPSLDLQSDDAHKNLVVIAREIPKAIVGLFLSDNGNTELKEHKCSIEAHIDHEDWSTISSHPDGPGRVRLRKALLELLESLHVIDERTIDIWGIRLSLRIYHERDSVAYLKNIARTVLTDPVIISFRRSIGKILGSSPVDFGIRRATVRALHDETRYAIARAFEPILNERAQALPQATYEDKKALAKWVNAELRELGLALRCPKTGLPALLLGHSGGVPGVGRFHLEVTDAQGVPRRTVTSATLPALELRPDDLARGHYAERRGRSR